MSNFHIVLCEPEIPPNTGNIIRLCANAGCDLHLIHPLGFSVDDKQLRRAGLDYHSFVKIHEFKNFDDFIQSVKPKRLFAIETCGQKKYSDQPFQIGDYFLFGSETKGLSKEVIQKINSENILIIPMQPNIRSLNLSNTVAVVIYEAWRQNNFVIPS